MGRSQIYENLIMASELRVLSGKHPGAGGRGRAIVPPGSTEAPVGEGGGLASPSQLCSLLVVAISPPTRLRKSQGRMALCVVFAIVASPTVQPLCTLPGLPGLEANPHCWIGSSLPQRTPKRPRGRVGAGWRTSGGWVRSQEAEKEGRGGGVGGRGNSRLCRANESSRTRWYQIPVGQ